MKPELLPCPLCGQEASIETRNVSLGGGDTAFWVGVGCPSDDLNHTACAHRLGPGWYGGRTEEGDASLLTEAVKAWNTRAAPATDDALDAMLEAFADKANVDLIEPVAWGIFRSGFAPDEDEATVLQKWNEWSETRQTTYRRALAAIAAMQAHMQAARNKALDDAAEAAFTRLHPHPNQPESDWTEYARTRAEAAKQARTAIRALSGEELSIRDKALDEAAAKCADRVARAEQAIRICPKKDAEFHREARDTAKFLGAAILALKEQHNG